MLPVAPTEEDDLHTPDKKPQTTFLEEKEGTIELTSAPIIHARINSVYPIREILFFIDDELQSTQTASSSLIQEYAFPVPHEFQSGQYIAKLVVYDTVGNTTSHEVHITIPPSSNATL